MRMFKTSIALLLALAVMAGAVSAAPTRIASITDRIDGPFRVAVDDSGNLYVTEPSKNLVVIYSSEGKYLRSFSVTYPLGIAVDAAGMIYVGSFTSGKPEYKNSVEIYSPDLVFTGSLGIGKGEVGRPHDIAIGPDGKVYVADSIKNIVKGYDTVAGSSFTFTGTFKRPSAIAVSNVAGSPSEVYIVDFRDDATLGEVARIQVFNTNGQFQRSFDFPVAQSPYPGGIAVDISGLLYVTASRLSYVTVLDRLTGASVGTFKDPSKMMYTAQGIAISRNGLAYVASAGSEDGKGRVDIFALDGYVTMAVDPLSLTFVGKQYAGNPEPQTIIISNTSGTNGGTLNWSATADQPWIILDAGQGSVAANSAGGLPVRVDISSFGSGAYSGTITIDPGFGQKKIVNVTVSVVPANILNISNGWLDFTAKTGTTPAAQNITIGVDNLMGSLSWSVASDSPWLKAAPASGAVTAAAPSSTVMVSADTTGLIAKADPYKGILTVTAPGAIGTPGRINVNLYITTSTKIAVTTNRSDAKFLVSGPITTTGSGSAWSVPDVPAGVYTVTFDAVSGYRKPLPQSKTLAENSEINFSGTYVSWKELAAKKNIVVAKGPDMRNDAQIKVYKGNGAPVAFDLVALATRYGANVAVGDVDGDGVAEVIVGAGNGPNNTAIVRIFRAADKSPLTEFVPFATMNGVRVAAADLDGDGKAEVLVSPAGGVTNTGKVAAYAYDTVQKKMIATGIEFTAYADAYGANIAVADMDGNGKPVIVTAPGSGSQNPALIKIWTIDTTAQVGSWAVSANPVKEISLPGTGGATITAGDLDGDGRSEIIAGTSDDHAMLTIIKADGSPARLRVPDRHSVNVAAADLDGDGNAEIITATGPERSGQETADDATGTFSEKLSTRKKDGKEKEKEYGNVDHERGAVRVFSASGVLLQTIVPFEETKDGINIAVGDLGL